ncbi:MAG: hypothetical protein ABIQ24_03245 [Nitrospiraceae bacterium]
MLIWATDKPMVPGWYWHRIDSVDLDPVIVRVEPQSNTVGPWGDGSTSRLSLAEGEWAGPLKPPT